MHGVEPKVSLRDTGTPSPNSSRSIRSELRQLAISGFWRSSAEATFAMQIFFPVAAMLSANGVSVSIQISSLEATWPRINFLGRRA